MKRSVQTVRREMANLRERWMLGGQAADPSDLARWLLLLEPPKRKVRPRDPARSARRATVKELDALCREVVFLRDQGKCRRCGKPAVDWSHVYSRRYKWLRWDLDNSSASCKGCHLKWHERPLDGSVWWHKEIGDQRYRALVARAARPSKVNMVAEKLALEKARKEYA